MGKMDFLEQRDELLVKYLTGIADETERNDALCWIRQSDEHRKYFDELRDVYEAAKITQNQSNYNVDLSWERVKSLHYKKKLAAFQEADKSKYRMFIRGIIKYAAIILTILVLGGLSFQYMKKSESIPLVKDIWNNIEAPFGSRARLTLVDGTKVWLNAGSQLRYSSAFAKNNREVFLEGEAYFEVAHDNSVQFVVKTSHLNIKVFGTEFNVKAYPDENFIQTTLVKGSITIEGAIISKTGKHIVYLKPNQTATYYIHEKKEIKTQEKDNILLEKKLTGKENMEILHEVNPEVYTSWKDTRWMIEGEPMLSLAKKLERRYNVTFVFNSKALQRYKFTGTLKDETLEQVLNLIKLSAPIEYQIENNNVILDENKSFKNSYDELLIKKQNEETN
jgi:transmembrane sensor